MQALHVITIQKYLIGKFVDIKFIYFLYFG